jgi:hypothetical protein
MSPERWRRIKNLIMQRWSATPEHPAFQREACRDDSDLKWNRCFRGKPAVIC